MRVENVEKVYADVVALRNVTMMTHSVLSGVCWNCWHVIVYVNEMRAAKIDYPKMRNVKVMWNRNLIIDGMGNVMAFVHVKWSNEN